ISRSSQTCSVCGSSLAGRRARKGVPRQKKRGARRRPARSLYPKVGGVLLLAELLAALSHEEANASGDRHAADECEDPRVEARTGEGEVAHATTTDATTTDAADAADVAATNTGPASHDSPTGVVDRLRLVDRLVADAIVVRVRVVAVRLRGNGLVFLLVVTVAAPARPNGAALLGDLVAVAMDIGGVSLFASVPIGFVALRRHATRRAAAGLGARERRNGGERHERHQED